MSSEVFYVILSPDDEVAAVGVGKYSLKRGFKALEFSSIAEREKSEIIQKYRRDQGISNALREVEKAKTSDEYSGKAENAARWLSQGFKDDRGDYSEDLYPWMALEIDAVGITPRECAESIDYAIRKAEGSPLEKARKRIRMREMTRQSMKIVLAEKEPLKASK